MTRRGKRKSKIHETDEAALGKVRTIYEDQNRRVTLRSRRTTKFCNDNKGLRDELEEVTLKMWPEEPRDYEMSSSQQPGTLCIWKQLRVDLQGMTRHKKQANIQVQINGQKPPSSIAAILIPTDESIPTKDIRGAVIDSNKMRGIMIFAVEQLKKQ